MVDIASKLITSRSATAHCTLTFSDPSTYAALTSATLAKGDALAVARVAGIQAAKQTSMLLPLAHPSLSLTSISITLKPYISNAREASTSTSGSALGSGVRISARVSCDGRTGVEMEALTAVTVAGLTLYDMCKGVDKKMILSQAYVTRKSGGKSGSWVFEPWKEEREREKGLEIEREKTEKELETLRAQRAESLARLRGLLKRVERREGRGQDEGWDEMHWRVGARALESRWKMENEGTAVVMQDGRTARKWDGERMVVERVEGED